MSCGSEQRAPEATANLMDTQKLRFRPVMLPRGKRDRTQGHGLLSFVSKLKKQKGKKPFPFFINIYGRERRAASVTAQSRCKVAGAGSGEGCLAHRLVFRVWVPCYVLWCTLENNIYAGFLKTEPFFLSLTFSQSISFFFKKSSQFPIISSITTDSGDSGSKESPCSAGDPGSIPRSGDPLEKRMATHSRVLAWEILQTEELGGLQVRGVRVGHD